MKQIKYLLITIILTISTNLQAQDEDYYFLMGQPKAEILKSDFAKEERIVTGNYYELGFVMSEDKALFFYFDKNLLCESVSLIHKNFNDYEKAQLILSGDFPKKTQVNGSYYYWNERMMAVLMNEKDRFIVVYQKVRPELLPK